jgi:hypothetical protein
MNLLKNNNDIMQCVICNKSSLFTLRPRACEKQKKKTMWNEFLKKKFWKWEIWDVNNIAMMHLESNWINFFELK